MHVGELRMVVELPARDDLAVGGAIRMEERDYKNPSPSIIIIKER